MALHKLANKFWSKLIVIIMLVCIAYFHIMHETPYVTYYPGAVDKNI